MRPKVGWVDEADRETASVLLTTALVFSNIFSTPIIATHCPDAGMNM